MEAEQENNNIDVGDLSQPKIFSEEASEAVTARVIPENALDYNQMLIKPEWGTKNTNTELYGKLEKKSYQKIGVDKETGQPLVLEIKKNLWAIHGFFTQDMRLSNLTAAQVKKIIHYLELAGDFLSLEPMMLDPFSACLNYIIPELEVNQSRGGWLRNLQNTIKQIHELKNLNDEQRRNILSGKPLTNQAQQ